MSACQDSPPNLSHGSHVDPLGSRRVPQVCTHCSRDRGVIPCTAFTTPSLCRRGAAALSSQCGSQLLVLVRRNAGSALRGESMERKPRSAAQHSELRARSSRGHARCLRHVWDVSRFRCACARQSHVCCMRLMLRSNASFSAFSSICFAFSFACLNGLCARVPLHLLGLSASV